MQTLRNIPPKNSIVDERNKLLQKYISARKNRRFPFFDNHFNAGENTRFSRMIGGLYSTGMDYTSQSGIYIKNKLIPDVVRRFKLKQTDWNRLTTDEQNDEMWVSLKRIRDRLPPDMMLSVEGLDFVTRLEQIQELKSLEVRSVQLTYNHQNQWATGCLVWDEKGHYDNSTGINQKAAEKIRALMDAGITIDVSHLNKQSTLDICQIARTCGKPVIASHSNTLMIFDSQSMHPAAGSDGSAQRCLDDEEIVAILKTGGYIGLMPVPWFLNMEIRDRRVAIANNQIAAGSRQANRKETLATLIRHIRHVRNLAKRNGMDPARAVALASDVDPECIPLGYGKTELSAPNTDYSRIFEQLAEILRGELGWKDLDIENMMSGNAKRIFGLIS